MLLNRFTGAGNIFEPVYCVFRDRKYIGEWFLSALRQMWRAEQKRGAICKICVVKHVVRQSTYKNDGCLLWGSYKLTEDYSMGRHAISFCGTSATLNLYLIYSKQTEVRYLMFSQRYCWGLKSSGVTLGLWVSGFRCFERSFRFHLQGKSSPQRLDRVTPQNNIIQALNYLHCTYHRVKSRGLL
jgi:hypothetical protein